jgi:putative membrane protein
MPEKQPPAPTGQPVAPPPPAPTGQPVAPPPVGPPVHPQAAPPTSTQLASGKHKVHHSYVWMTALSTLFAFIMIGLFGILPVIFEEGLYGALSSISFEALVGGSITIPVVLLAIIIGLQILGYKNLSFEFTESEFNLYSGIITKKRVHVPYQRVQSVNHNATLLQRIIGVCSVTIETAGGASNKAIRVPYVQNIVAEQIRTELFSRKAFILQGEGGQRQPASAEPNTGQASPGSNNTTPRRGGHWPPTSTEPSTGTGGQWPPPQPTTQPAGAQSAATAPTNLLDQTAGSLAGERGVFGGAAYQTGIISYECRLTNKELILTALSNSSSILAVIFSIAVTILGVFGGDIITAILDYAFLQGGDSFTFNRLVSSAVQRASLPLAGVGILVVIVLWLIGLATTCISFGGFRACRRNNRIEVERGLLQHQFSGIDIERVQSVVIRQSFIRRCIGYCELTVSRIDSADEGDNKQQQQSLASKGLIIHPFVKLSRVPEILAGLVPEYANLPQQQISLPKVAKRRAIIRRCLWRSGAFWTAVCAAVLQLIMYIILLSGVIDPAGLDADARTAIEVMITVVNSAAILCYVIFAIMLVINTVGALLWFKTSSYAYNQEFMTIKNGGLHTESISFKRKKIQYGYTKTNPLQRWAKVASINVVTAAGVGGTTTRLLDAPEEAAWAWLAWLRPGGNKESSEALWQKQS